MRTVLLALVAISAFAQTEQSTTRLNVRPYTPSGGGTSLGEIRFYDIISGGGSYISLSGQSQVNSNYALTLPKESAMLMATQNHQYDASNPFTFATYRARGTESSPSDISAGDSLGLWTGYGRTSSAYSQMAGVQLVAATTTTGSIDFYTRNGGGYNPRINISEDGHIYPYGVSTQDVGASSVRFRKGWFADLDVSGTCTGCGGAPPITWTLETNADILTMQHHLSSGTVARNILSQYSRGTNASPSAAAASDTVWSEKWQYYAGGAYRDAGAIFVNVPSGVTVSSTNSPGHVSIFATNHGATSGTEVVRFGAQTFSETPTFGAKWFSGMWPSVTATHDIGAFGAEWLTLWASRIRTSSTNNIDFYPGNAQRWSMGYVNGTITPTTDTGPSIGSQTARVNSVWATQFNTYTHNSWGIQTSSWTADHSVYHRLTSYGAGGSTYPVSEYRKARGTEASPSALSDGDYISWHLFEGYAPSGAFVFSGYIRSTVDGTPSGLIVPASVVIGTMNASGVTGERFRVRASGDIEIPGNLTVSGTCTGCGSGGTPPIDWHLDSGSTPLTLSNHGTVSASQLTSRFSRGTYASPSAASTGDLIGNHTFRYYAGGAYRDAAAIFVNIPSSGVTVSGSSSPASVSIYATPDGATTGSEVVRHGALGGSLGFGTEYFQNVIPYTNLTLDLGAFGIEWLTVWASRIRTSGSTAIDFYPGNTHRWTMTTGAGSLSPVTDGGPSIGSQSFKPNATWSRTFNTYTDSGYGTQSSQFTADANLNLYLTVYSGTASDRPALQMYRARGSSSSPSSVSDNDALGNVAFFGYAASGGMQPAAIIRGNVDGTPGASITPGELVFITTDSGGANNTNLTISANGDVTARTWMRSLYFDTTGGYHYNGTAGVTTTFSVRNAADTGSCSISVSGGIITSTTC